MTVTEFKAKLVNFPSGSSFDPWWADTELLRIGSMDWYYYAENSYLYIPYLESIEIEDLYQKELNGQRDLFK